MERPILGGLAWLLAGGASAIPQQWPVDLRQALVVLCQIEFDG